MNRTIEFCISELVWVANFTLNKKLWILGLNLHKKGISVLETEKVNITIEFCIFELSLGTKFHFKQIILNFRAKFAQKRYFSQKQKSEQHHWILHIRISLGTKFYFDQFWILELNLPSEHHHWILHIWISVGTKFHFNK